MSLRGSYTIFFLLTLFCNTNPAQALTLGEIYDSKSWQQIEGMAPQFMINLLKHGDFLLKTGKINFDVKLEKNFLKASHENTGRFDIDEHGAIIEKTTHKPPLFVYGLPFPEIDSKDPKAGSKIMTNFKFAERRFGGTRKVHVLMLIGKGGIEQEIYGTSDTLYYQGHPDKSVLNMNKDNFLRQTVSLRLAPMSLKGSVSMTWRYGDERQDACFSYSSSLRRLRRIATAYRSDPSYGSEFCPDDNGLWSGKSETFRWRLIGEDKVLCPFFNAEKISIEEGQDGVISRKFPVSRIGYEVADWAGAPWAHLDLIWAPRAVWIIEGIPKDPHYNSGKQLFYVDQDTFILWFKDVYNPSGTHVKSFFSTQSFQVAPSGRNTLLLPVDYCGIDDQNGHASCLKYLSSYSGYKESLYVPLTKIGPGNFTLSGVQQLSK